jgi:hypothetical protein
MGVHKMNVGREIKGILLGGKRISAAFAAV